MADRSQVASRIRFGTFEVDLESGELRRNGVRLKLQEQPFQLLAMFLERPGEVVTRDAVRERLWPADTFVDFDHSLNTAIKLRQALGDSAENQIHRDAGPARLPVHRTRERGCASRQAACRKACRPAARGRQPDCSATNGAAYIPLRVRARRCWPSRA